MKRKATRTQPLPDVLRIVFKIGGADCLIALSREIGGRRIKIPKHPSDQHPLVKGCGRKAADAVARYHGGEEIEFPSARNVVNLLIARAMVAGGASHNDVQKALGVSWRTARRIRDRLLKQGIPQLDMQPVKDPRKHNPNQIDLEDLLAG